MQTKREYSNCGLHGNEIRISQCDVGREEHVIRASRSVTMCKSPSVRPSVPLEQHGYRQLNLLPSSGEDTYSNGSAEGLTPTTGPSRPCTGRWVRPLHRTTPQAGYCITVVGFEETAALACKAMNGTAQMDSSFKQDRGFVPMLHAGENKSCGCFTQKVTALQLYSSTARWLFAVCLPDINQTSAPSHQQRVGTMSYKESDPALKYFHIYTE